MAQGSNNADMTAPTNPWPSIIVGFIVVFGALGGFGAWSALANLSSAVVAQGTVKVYSNRKKVQTLEGGVVTELAVKNGDRVEVGDILVTLDRTRAAASHSIMQSNYDTSLAVVARLRAERDGLENIDYPEGLAERLEGTSVSEIISAQEKLFSVRRAALNGQTAIVRERIGQLEEEIQGLNAQVSSKDRQLKLIEEELSGLRELYKKGFTTRTRILSLEREAASLGGERGEHLAAIAQSRRLIGEAQLEIVQVQKTFNEEVVTELQQKESELFDLEERLNATNYSLEQTQITATAKGLVVGLAVHTVGGVLQPGETLLEIVPENDLLIVEAKVLPIDVDNIQIGLGADVQFTAFSQRTTPKLHGDVIYVSADSLTDPDTKAPYFAARIAIPEEEVARLDDKTLQPGMPADVLIITGDRTPMNYLIKPIKESMDKAWRED
ncbi:HlyD family type I secretion periplasmic adaptor subunit [Denitrobaculum tricleocarpae]|uniref:Membrane fusion protein (MFP) family protein n=1 Tax=Denitrobaculum tricleocarpae TaxID=2591009 RepID=A0A545TAZ6_9PROT|nr:HlyD family type I secretion periplasmic adaptor subunit [Denitrobaculum tricleocarpae]TQV74392.1 HlyD family type I secretion periplasmic adaptor subunit [Denitrobaculum tricleocarpae]